jgi:hypothetical protein
MRSKSRFFTYPLCALLFLSGFIATAADSSAADWRTVLKQRLQSYGHRNWIVVADSAYPEQSAEGIETIISNEAQLAVLREVLADIAASKHVRAIPHTDRELNFLGDSDAPGVSAYRDQLYALLPDAQNNSQRHEEIIHALDAASKTFRVLIIKTNMTVPYTSVFLELDCAYWTPEAEQILRARMAR